jgi:hypothetical protein
MSPALLHAARLMREDHGVGAGHGGQEIVQGGPLGRTRREDIAQAKETVAARREGVQSRVYGPREHENLDVNK